MAPFTAHMIILIQDLKGMCTLRSEMLNKLIRCIGLPIKKTLLQT